MTEMHLSLMEGLFYRNSISSCFSFNVNQVNILKLVIQKRLVEYIVEKMFSMVERHGLVDHSWLVCLDPEIACSYIRIQW